MRALVLLTLKNLKLLLRSKSSALIILFAPLLMMLLLGLSYNNTDNYGIKIGIFAAQATEDTENFMALLEEKGFSVELYEDSIETCVSDIKAEKVHTCISLPASLSVDGNEQKEVTFYVDPTRINLVWVVQETVKEEFNLKAQEISEQLAQEILSKLSDTQTKIAEQLTDLTTLKEKVNGASGSAQSAMSSLGEVDLTTNSSEYDLTVISTLQENLDESKNKIKDAMDAVESTALEAADKDKIKNPLSAARTSINDAAEKIDGNGTASVQGIITSLQSDLSAAKEKLAGVGAAISATNSNLEGVNKNLQESIGTIDTLSSALGEIQTQLSSQKVTEAGTIATPLITKIEKVHEQGTYLNYLFPALLVLIVMFSSLLLGTTLVLMEKTSPAFLRNFFLPVSKVTFIFSLYLTNLLVVILELLIVLGLSLLFLEGTLALIPAVILILLVTASVFILIGMAIGYLFNSEETGVLASISTGSIFLFVSGVILPLESVAPLLQEIVYFNPFVIAEGLIRRVFLFATPISELSVDIGTLAAYALVLFILISLFEVFFHNHLIQRYVRHHHFRHRQNEKRMKNKG